MTPSQLVRALQALLETEAFRRFREEGPYLVRGIYVGSSGNKKSYAGFYYDTFKDSDGKTSITLKAPPNMTLQPGRIYLLSVVPELKWLV